MVGVEEQDEILNIETCLSGIELFMRKCEQPTYRVVAMPNLDDCILRLRLILEELMETVGGLLLRNKVEVIDGMCDVVYVGGGGILLFTEDSLVHDGGVYANTTPTDYMMHQTWVESYLELIDDVSYAYTRASIPGFQSLTETRKKVYELSYRAVHLVVDHADSGNIPLQAFFDEVQRSNMTKLPVIKSDADGEVIEYGKAIKDKGGKVLKPETFSKVNFIPIFEQFGI